MESIRLLTKDLAKRFGVNPSTIRRAVDKGKLPYPIRDRLGYNYWLESELNAFIEEYGIPHFRWSKHGKEEKDGL